MGCSSDSKAKIVFFRNGLLGSCRNDDAAASATNPSGRYQESTGTHKQRRPLLHHRSLCPPLPNAGVSCLKTEWAEWKDDGRRVNKGVRLFFHFLNNFYLLFLLYKKIIKFLKTEKRINLNILQNIKRFD